MKLIGAGWAGFLEMIDGLLWQGRGTFAGHKDSAEALMEQMARHHEEVKASIPAERLLVWDVTQGWEPLCEFLEVPVPDAPFPNVNDSKEFVERIHAGALAKLNEWHGQTAAGGTAASA